MAGLFKGKDQKGMQCHENPDGSQTCKRVFKDPKSGEIMTDGQEVTVIADPSNNCKPRIIGDSTVLDGDWSQFDEIASRVSSGCEKNRS